MGKPMSAAGSTRVSWPYLSSQPQGGSKGRQRYLLGAFVLAGVLAMMLLLGLIIALLSISIGRAAAGLDSDIRHAHPVSWPLAASQPQSV